MINIQAMSMNREKGYLSQEDKFFVERVMNIVQEKQCSLLDLFSNAEELCILEEGRSMFNIRRYELLNIPDDITYPILFERTKGIEVIVYSTENLSGSNNKYIVKVNCHEENTESILLIDLTIRFFSFNDEGDK